MTLLFWPFSSSKKILIYADFMDPFCFIGFHNARLAAQEHGLMLEWRGFELNPDTPPEGYVLETGANSDLRPGMWASVKGLAEASGLLFPEPQKVPNTRMALALVEIAKRRAENIPLIETIYQAYFMRQWDIGSQEVLVQLATPLGLSLQEIESALRGTDVQCALETHRQEALARQFPGMPGFVYRGKMYFGALSREAWGKILG